MEVFGPGTVSRFVCLGLSEPVGPKLSTGLQRGEILPEHPVCLQKPTGRPGGLGTAGDAGNFRTCGPSEKDPLAPASERLRVWVLRKQWLGEPHVERPRRQEVALHILTEAMPLSVPPSL